MQTTISAPIVPVTLPACLWRGCAGELRWRNAKAEAFAAEIDIACQNADAADLVTMQLPRMAVLALRGVGAFFDDYPEPRTVEPEEDEDAPTQTTAMPYHDDADHESEHAAFDTMIADRVDDLRHGVPACRLSDLAIDAATTRADLRSLADEISQGAIYTERDGQDIALVLARACDLITLLAGLEQHDAAA
ncbi:MAG: hypothetical protein M3Q71_18665 [Chloroflexota bacterium]|nr:hypothetical protein [Chloroflexota bacterium]